MGPWRRTLSRYDHARFGHRVIIQLTARCPVRCAHCLVHGGPGEAPGLAGATLDQIIVALGRRPGTRRVVLTGGEPFDDLGRLRGALAAGVEAGLELDIVTNAFWATSGVEARRVLADLPGSLALSISASRHHAAAIPPRYVSHAASAALERGCQVGVFVTVDGHDDPYPGIVARQLGETLCGRVEMVVQTVHRAGRAVSWDPTVAPVALGELAAQACPLPAAPAVLPDGRVVACCGDVVADPDAWPGLVLGRVPQQPMDELLDRAHGSALVQALRIHGPAHLARLVERRAGQDVFAARRFDPDNPCSVCRELLTRSEIEPLLERVLVSLCEGGGLARQRLLRLGEVARPRDRRAVLQPFVRRQLAAVQQLAVPDVPGASFPVHDMRDIARFEPRIEYLARRYAAGSAVLLEAGELDGPQPRSFHLADLGQWTVGPEHDSLDAYSTVLQYLSSPCTGHCDYCLHLNDPPGRWTRSGQWRHTHVEIEARLQQYDPGAMRALFRTQDYNSHDITTHPQFDRVLAAIRARTDEPIGFTTCSAALAPEVVAGLAAHGPVFLMVSLQTWDLPRGRRALEALRREGIFAAASAVIHDDDALARLGEVVAIAQEADASVVRVIVPGYSRFYTGPPALADAASRLRAAITERAEDLRRQFEIPILVQPSHLGPAAGTCARIDGVVRRSPAHVAGLKVGDEIVRIGEQAVGSKAEAVRLLEARRLLRMTSMAMRVRRDGRDLDVSVHEVFSGPLDETRRPHVSHLATDAVGFDPSYPYGIVLQPTFDPALLTTAREIIVGRGARDVLVVCSTLLEPTVRRAIEDLDPFAGLETRVTLAVPANEHYLGGSVLPGDLLVVEDLVDCIAQRPRRPDLALLPATIFGRWGRDIRGRSWLEIERAVGVSVALIRNPLLTGL